MTNQRSVAFVSSNQLMNNTEEEQTIARETPCLTVGAHDNDAGDALSRHFLVFIFRSLNFQEVHMSLYQVTLV